MANPFAGSLTGKVAAPAAPAKETAGNIFAGALTGKTPAAAPAVPAVAPITTTPQPAPQNAFKGALGGYGASPNLDMPGEKSANSAPLGQNYATVPVTVPKTFMSPATTIQEEDTSRVAPKFDPTKAQPVTSDMLQNGRMPSSISTALRKQFGASSFQELDHVMPLELGGSNNALTNLRKENGEDTSKPYSPGSNPTATDPLENQLAADVHSGKISLLDAWRQMAKSKGVTLKEDSAKSGPIDTALLNTPSILKPLASAQDAITGVAGKVGNFFKGLLTKPNETIKSFNDTAFHVAGGDAIVHPIQAVKNIMKQASDSSATVLSNLAHSAAQVTSDFQSNRSATDKAASVLGLLQNAALTALYPVTETFNIASQLPVIKPAADAVGLIFGPSGAVAGFSGQKLFDSIPNSIVSTEKKAKLDPIVKSVSTLIGQIVLGGYIYGKITGGMDPAKVEADATQKGKDLNTASAWNELGRPKDMAEAEKNYKSMAHEAHPDLGGSNEAMSKLNQAYDTLKANGFPSSAIQKMTPERIVPKEKAQAALPSGEEKVTTPKTEEVPKSLTEESMPDEKMQTETASDSRAGFANPGEAMEGIKENIADAKTYIQETQKTAEIEKDVNDNYYKLVTNGKKMDDIFSKRFLEKADISPEDQEAIYHWIENKNEPITPEQKAKFEQHIKPLQDESNKLFAKIKGEDVPLNPEDYTTRVVQNKGSILDRLQRGFKSTRMGGLLGKTAGFMKHRTMMAIEDAKGNRTAVSVKNGRVVAFNKGMATDLGPLNEKTGQDVLDKETTTFKSPTGERDITMSYKQLGDRIVSLEKELQTLSRSQGSEEANARRITTINRDIENYGALQAKIEEKFQGHAAEQKVFVDKNGESYKLTQATTKEIEENTNVKYYKTPLVNELNRYNKLNQIDRAMQFLESTKKQLETDGRIKKFGSADVPENWKQTDLPQFRGYLMPKKISNVLDLFYRQIGKGNDVGIYTKINNFMRTTIFFNPLIHVPNIAVHWAVGRGAWRFLSPKDYVRGTKAGIKAIKATLTVNDDYTEALRQGAPLLYSEVGNKDLYNVMMQKAGLELQNNGSFHDEMAKMLNLPVSVVKATVGRLYDFSGKVTWAVNDIATLQAIFEEQSRGAGWEDAIKDVGKHIPNYRMPPEIFGSKELMDVVKNPNITMFSAYHYGALRSYFEMAKDLVAGKDVKERASSLDKILMLGIVTYVLYPQLDRLAKLITGNANAHLRRAGASTFISNTQQLLSGQKDFVTYLESVVTPSVPLQVGISYLQGKLAIPTRTEFQTAPWASVGSTISMLGAQTISPLGYASNITSGKKSWQDTLFGFIGISTAQTSPHMMQTYDLIYNQRPALVKTLKTMIDQGSGQQANTLIEQYNRDLFDAYVGVMTDRGETEATAKTEVTSWIQDPQTKVGAQFIKGISAKQMQNYKQKQNQSKLQNLILK